MDKEKLPEPFVTVLALLKFDDAGFVPAVGFIANTTDTNEPYFHCASARCGYDISTVIKWDYLDEVAPGYCVPGGHKNNQKGAKK